MPQIDVGGVPINYIDEGAGPAIVLVHGFASSLQGNWRGPGIVDALMRAGRRVVAIDCRGHGRSGKSHDPDAYGGTKMADDVIAVMDHLGIDCADLWGYWMGGFIAASLLVRHPHRFRSVILSGVGNGLLLGGRSRANSEAIARALEAKSASDAEHATARAFRVFAEQVGNDLQALAAIQRSSREGFDPAKLRETDRPVLVLIGQGDTLVGPAEGLAAAIPGATLVKVPGDHITAVASPEFKEAALAFLAAHSPADRQ